MNYQMKFDFNKIIDAWKKISSEIKNPENILEVYLQIVKLQLVHQLFMKINSNQ